MKGWGCPGPRLAIRRRTMRGATSRVHAVSSTCRRCRWPCAHRSITAIMFARTRPWTTPLPPSSSGPSGGAHTLNEDTILTVARSAHRVRRLRESRVRVFLPHS